MIAVFSLEPKSLIMAFMLSRLRDAKAIQFDPTKRYFFDEVTDTRHLDYHELYDEFRERFGGLDFLEDNKLYEVIRNEIFWALRFKSRDSSSLILHVLRQIESSGSKNYLSEETVESREMRLRVKKVLSEFNRAVRFIRFTRYDRPALSISNASFDNDIADMVLRVEAVRSPGLVTAIYDDRSVRILSDGKPYLAKRKRVPINPNRKEFRQFWGGLPDSGKSILVEDLLHTIDEIPSIAVPKISDFVESAGRLGAIATLDKFL